MIADVFLNSQIQLLCDAIINVDRTYLWYEDNVAEIENEPPKAVKHLERVFAYQLYHEWSILLKGLGSELTLNAEISKCVYDEIKNKETTVFPDFVLHCSQGNDNMQLLVCEVKRRVGTTKELIKADIIALASYLDKNLFSKDPFEIGIFVLVGCEQSFLIDRLKDLNTNKLTDYDDKILCITYNYSDKLGYTFSKNTLSNLIK